MITIESFTLDDQITFDAPRGFSRTVDLRRVLSGCGSEEAFSRWIMNMARHGIRQRCADKYATTRGDAETKNRKLLEMIGAFHNGGTLSGRVTDPIMVEIKGLLRKAKFNSTIIKEIRTLSDVERVLGDKANAFIQTAKRKIAVDEEFLDNIKD